MKKLIINIFKTFLFFDISLIIIHYLPVLNGKNTALVFLENIALQFAVVSVLSLIFVFMVERNKIKVQIKPSPKKLYQGAICGACLPVSGILVAFVFKKIKFGAFSISKDLGLWIIALLLWSVMTELLLRGYLFSLYKKDYGFTVATIITTLLFLAMDITIFEHSKIYTANIILFNIMLCFILDYTNSVIATVSARFVFFLLNTVLLGFTYPLGGYLSLFEVTFSGNKFFNGGEYGIFGSILTLILLSLITAFSIYKKYDIFENAKKFIKNTKVFIKDLKWLFKNLEEKVKALVSKFKKA